MHFTLNKACGTFEWTNKIKVCLFVKWNLCETLIKCDVCVYNTVQKPIIMGRKLKNEILSAHATEKGDDIKDVVLSSQQINKINVRLFVKWNWSAKHL